MAKQIHEEHAEVFRLKSGDRVVVRKHHRGCYRLRLTADDFGQVRRESPHQWLAEVRKAETGDLIRYAGFWPTRRQAIEELVSL